MMNNFSLSCDATTWPKPLLSCSHDVWTSACARTRDTKGPVRSCEEIVVCARMLAAGRDRSQPVSLDTTRPCPMQCNSAGRKICPPQTSGLLCTYTRQTSKRETPTEEKRRLRHTELGLANQQRGPPKHGARGPRKRKEVVPPEQRSLPKPGFCALDFLPVISKGARCHRLSFPGARCHRLSGGLQSPRLRSRRPDHAAPRKRRKLERNPQVAKKLASAGAMKIGEQ